jgi:uncharacterized iron-regulated membrane protein
MTFRKVIFWSHLVCGVAAGLIIAVMCVTGAAIAFEKQGGAWAERDVSRVQVPNGARALPLDELLDRAREARPESRPSVITVTRDPGAAVLITFGRSTEYANPYTGELRAGTAPRLRAFFQSATEWHRWLGTSNENRAAGKAATGAANIIFLILAISGLVLWWPRSFSWRALRPSVWFVGNLRGKARDWNWHNAVGFWCAPLLIVLTVTGAVISYRWVGNLVYALTGSVAPSAAAPAVEVPAPSAGAKPLGQEALLAAAQRANPSWEQITFRLTGRERPAARSTPRSGGPSAVNISVRNQNAWPRFAATQLWLDPFTGAPLLTETFSDASTGRKARSWMRFLHTGEALGIVGQSLATLACCGGFALVWTGFALVFRRFFRRGSAQNSE